MFGMVPQLNLDLGMLEHQFHKLSRKLHPDRLHGHRRTRRSGAWRHSAAKRRLSDAEGSDSQDGILLKLHGAEIGEEHAGKDRKIK